MVLNTPIPYFRDKKPRLVVDPKTSVNVAPVNRVLCKVYLCTPSHIHCRFGLAAPSQMLRGSGIIPEEDKPTTEKSILFGGEICRTMEMRVQQWLELAT